MEIEDLDDFLLEEQSNINFPLNQTIKQRYKDPLEKQNALLDYEQKVEDVRTFVYKIQVGDEIAVGRTSRPRSRYLSHANKKQTKAHFIIHKSEDWRDISKVMTILWERPASESEQMEAHYIEMLSTCGQSPEESSCGTHATSYKNISSRDTDISTRIGEMRKSRAVRLSNGEPKY